MQQYTIKEVSEMFSLPPSTLRYYEDMGILTQVDRTAAGQRIYYEKHIRRLRTVCCFKTAGMSISQLKTFFGYEAQEEDHIDEILQLLQTHQETVEEELAQLQKAYAHLQKKLRYYSDIKTSLHSDMPRPQWADYR